MEVADAADQIHFDVDRRGAAYQSGQADANGQLPERHMSGRGDGVPAGIVSATSPPANPI